MTPPPPSAATLQSHCPLQLGPKTTGLPTALAPASLGFLAGRGWAAPGAGGGAEGGACAAGNAGEELEALRVGAEAGVVGVLEVQVGGVLDVQVGGDALDEPHAEEPHDEPEQEDPDALEAVVDVVVVERPLTFW